MTMLWPREDGSREDCFCRDSFSTNEFLRFGEKV
jgi:hypothetical protein